MNNIPAACMSDGYKFGHISQYKEGTEVVISNMTPRSDRLAMVHPEYHDGKIVYFGITYAYKTLVERWQQTFFNVPKEEAIRKYKRRLKNYLGQHAGDMQIEYMGKLHDLGYLPLEIKSLPEGSFVNMQVPFFTIKNTHKDFWWLVNYVETYISRTVYPMCNAASITREYYKTSKRYAKITKPNPSWLSIANHCFASRGHRGTEDAIMSGMGHMLFSVGTDTVEAIDALEQYYNADSDKEMVGISVNAFEHATATQRISYYRNNLGFNEYPLQAEVESLRDALTRLYPTGILSYVSDSEDYYALITEGMKELKDIILNRQPDENGLCKLVLRPDSSPKTPLEVICGDPDAEEGSPEYKGTLQILWETFGGTVNEAGYKVINDKVGIIYGEAIDIFLQDKIYKTMIEKGFCVGNVLLGMGSWGFLKNSSRDSYGIAIKGTYSIVNGEPVPMQKTPKTASKSKTSLKGLIRVEYENGQYVAYDEQTPEQEQLGCLEVIARDGKMIKEWSLSEIREYISSQPL